MTRQRSARKAAGGRSGSADGGGRARGLIRGLALGTIALVLVAGCSGGGSTPQPSPTSPGPMTLPATFTSLPTELQGTWKPEYAPMQGTHVSALTLQACDVGETCGRVDRIDDNAENCFYPLALTAGTAEEVTFATGGGNTFGCAWSPWSKGVLVLTPVSERTIQIDLQGPAVPPVTLTRQ